MSEFKLTYFNVMSRGEVSRLLFTLAGKEFAEKRIEFSEWRVIKPTFPLGQVPILEFDGKTMVQSMAIARYLAREFGLCGETSWDQAVGDMLCDTCNDVTPSCGKVKFFAKTEEEKAEHPEKVKTGIAGVAKLYGLYKRGKFVLGDKPTLGDAVVFALTDVVECAIPDLVSTYDILRDLRAEFTTVPAIAAYLQSRPVTPL